MKGENRETREIVQKILDHEVDGMLYFVAFEPVVEEASDHVHSGLMPKSSIIGNLDPMAMVGYLHSGLQSFSAKVSQATDLHITEVTKEDDRANQN